MANTDGLYLSNSPADGFEYEEFDFPVALTANETSALAASASNIIAVGPFQRNGHIVDFSLRAKPATSASGFVSATITADVHINSAAVCSTQPAIAMAGSAGQAVQKATNAGGGTSAVINRASAVFSVGDGASISYNARSVGSAAAGAAATGGSVVIRVRYYAR